MLEWWSCRARAEVTPLSWRFVRWSTTPDEQPCCRCRSGPGTSPCGKLPDCANSGRTPTPLPHAAHPAGSGTGRAPATAHRQPCRGPGDRAAPARDRTESAPVQRCGGHACTGQCDGHDGTEECPPAPVQRDFLSDAWKTATEAGPAAANAARLVAQVATNPAMLPTVMSAIAWDESPSRSRARSSTRSSRHACSSPGTSISRTSP